MPRLASDLIKLHINGMKLCK